MQTLTLSDSVRFRAAQGEAVFFNPFTREMVANDMHASDGKGSWVTLDEGTQFAIVGAYTKGSTYFLIVDETGQGLDHENSYGLVVRDLSMQNLLEMAFEEEEVSTALVAVA
tara:strand:- start:2 stop:337 length:336 start_codon:yes stop_codon:yes gene_type:complete